MRLEEQRRFPGHTQADSDADAVDQQRADIDAGSA